MTLLDEITTLVEQGNNKNIFFDKKTLKIYRHTNIQLMRAKYSNDNIAKDIANDFKNERYVQFIEYSKDFYKCNAEKLINQHKNKYFGKDIGAPFALTKFRKVTKELGLFDEWLNIIKSDICYDLYEFLNDNGLVDEEATEEMYSQITEVLENIKLSKCFDYINSTTLFEVSGKYSFLMFHLLKDDRFNGISFYFGDNNLDAYKSLSSEFPDAFAHKATMLSLVDICTFYFEKGEVDTLEKNPYSEKRDITSIVIMPGIYSKNYLSNSLAYFIIQALKDALKELNSTPLTTLKKLKSDERYIIKHFRNQKQELETLQPSQYIPERPFYDVNKDTIFYIEPKEYLNEKWSIGFRKIENYETISNKDQRVLYCNYLLLVVNEENNQIISFRLISGQGRPIENALSELEFLFNHKRIAKKIVVNTAFDDTIVSCAFGMIEDKKKIKVTFEPIRLCLDDAFEDFNKEVLQMDLNKKLDA